MSGEFSVCQFFADGSYEYYKRSIEAREAVKAAHFLSHNVAARYGQTCRVIITDGGDHCVFEWQRGMGVTWPTPEQLAAHRDAICPGCGCFRDRCACDLRESFTPGD
jgi:hypothetical protein